MKLYVTNLWVSDGVLYAVTDNGLTASYDLSTIGNFKRAKPSQLTNFEVRFGNDIHWPELDEDINLKGMFYDNNLCKLTPTEDSVVYRPLPETNDCVAEETIKE